MNFRGRALRRLLGLPGGARTVDALRVLRWGLPALQHSVEGRNSLSGELYVPGHFYSAIPDFEELADREAQLFACPESLPGIDLNLDGQIALIEQFRELKETPSFFSPERRLRFDIENDTFSYDDAAVLHFMLRLLSPRRVIEVGSGSSSACMLDTSDLSLSEPVDFTFVDIDCSRLRALLTPEDHARVTLIEQPVQDVDLALFRSLEADDILFIDSSHVVKAGSDVNHLFFEVLPRLRPGVVVHVHDVRYPFQYSRSLVLDRHVCWTEAYLLRALLTFTSAFQIVFWLSCLLNVPNRAQAALTEVLPLDGWTRRFGAEEGDLRGAGGSIWLRRRDP